VAIDTYRRVWRIADDSGFDDCWEPEANPAAGSADMIGAAGPAMLRLAARNADVRNPAADGLETNRRLKCRAKSTEGPPRIVDGPFRASNPTTSRVPGPPFKPATTVML
jgi:alkanesulfonate monooxygenase SsuD/methylene tetrahydromethanopterin reductase-like flavin-dependent oxidoreductase (luciferase family)